MWLARRTSAAGSGLLRRGEALRERDDDVERAGDGDLERDMDEMRTTTMDGWMR